MNMELIQDAFLHPFKLFLDPSHRLSLIYMIPALVVALLVYRRLHRTDPTGTPSLMAWLLPRDILLHPSAKADYIVFFFNKSLILLIYASILIQSGFWFDLTGQLLGTPDPQPHSWGVSILTTLVVILSMDFMLWLGHYIFHKVPFLWEFHKAHHSAEVLTPITATRVHPLDELITSLMSGFGIGVSAGVMHQIYGQGALIFSLFEINIILALFYFAAFNLRHSHVWVRYPVWLQHIFISPAQHQIHHSRAQMHWDKNMGFIFSIWDWAAGTLYAPKTRENLTFGLGNGEDGTWNSALTLYFRPFRSAYMLFHKGWRAALISDCPVSAKQQEDQHLEHKQ